MLGGYTNAHQNIIEFVVTASTGNATDFGDMTAANRAQQGGLSNGIIGIISGGGASGANEKITLDTNGDAVDFGDCFIADGGSIFSQAASSSASTPNVQP